MAELWKADFIDGPMKGQSTIVSGRPPRIEIPEPREFTVFDFMRSPTDTACIPPSPWKMTHYELAGSVVDEDAQEEILQHQQVKPFSPFIGRSTSMKLQMSQEQFRRVEQMLDVNENKEETEVWIDEKLWESDRDERGRDSRQYGEAVGSYGEWLEADERRRRRTV